MIEAVDERIHKRYDELVGIFDAYMEQEVLPTMNESVEDSVAELRKLMLLAVAEIGGQDAARAFINKVAALARAGALSSASGEWAAAGPNDSASNLDTVRGGSGTLRKEDVDDEIETAREIFR